MIYAPLKKAAFVCNSSFVNLLMDFREGKHSHSEDLAQEAYEFLQRLDLVDSPPSKPPMDGPTGHPNPTEITLFLTTGCNLRCTYCYASAGDTPLKKMSLETAKRGIDFVIENAAKIRAPLVEVGYHGGGEPTTNWSVLTESFQYAEVETKKRGIAINGSCATNGVLNGDQRKWLMEHFSGVSVSFDGLPESQDEHRPTVKGEGSSRHVIKTLQDFDQNNYAYGIRVTVTHDQIERMPESIAYICANFRPARIQVEPAYSMGRYSGAPSAETSSFIDQYRSSQNIARSYGKEITFSAVRPEILTNHFCSITRDGFSLSTEGEVTACYEAFSKDNEFSDVFFYGGWDGLKNQFELDLERLDHLRKQTVNDREFCKGCFAKWHCAGDCYHKSLTVNGRGEFKGSDRCHIIRELTKDLLLEWINKSGGLFWSDKTF